MKIRITEPSYEQGAIQHSITGHWCFNK